jgi:hypothetical protein
MWELGQKPVLGKLWTCEFVARTGARARATFATKDKAQHFAERHARAFVSAGTRLAWVNARNNSSAMTTPVGDYVVELIDQPKKMAARSELR